MNSTVNGSVQPEDTDYYVVEVPQGEMISAEIEGVRHANGQQGNGFFDPLVVILDDEGKELARSDDAALIQQDSICGVIAPATGRYYIAVRDSSFGGNRDANYRLHIGNYARPLAILPSGGRPGELLKATCIDALGNAWQEEFQLPSTPSDRFRVWSNEVSTRHPLPLSPC